MRDHPLIDVYDIGFPKEEYWNLMNEYAVILSLNGNGEFCVRDVEGMGFGIPVIRSELKSMRHYPLAPDVHYIKGSVVSDIAWMSYPGYTAQEIAQQFIEKLETIVYDDDFLMEIHTNGLRYYEQYGSNQKIVELFFELFDPAILEGN